MRNCSHFNSKLYIFPIIITKLRDCHSHQPPKDFTVTYQVFSWNCLLTMGPAK